MTHIDPAYIVAVTGAIATGTGIWLSRRGQDDTRTQQAAAQRVAEQTVRLQESTAAVQQWQAIAADRAQEIANLRVEVERNRARADSGDQRRDSERSRFQASLERCHEDTETLRAALLREVKHEAVKDVPPDRLQEIDKLIEDTPEDPEEEESDLDGHPNRVRKKRDNPKD